MIKKNTAYVGDIFLNAYNAISEHNSRGAILGGLSYEDFIRKSLDIIKDRHIDYIYVDKSSIIDEEYDFVDAAIYLSEESSAKIIVLAPGYGDRKRIKDMVLSGIYIINTDIEKTNNPEITFTKHRDELLDLTRVDYTIGLAKDYLSDEEECSNIVIEYQKKKKGLPKIHIMMGDVSSLLIVEEINYSKGLELLKYDLYENQSFADIPAAVDVLIAYDMDKDDIKRFEDGDYLLIPVYSEFESFNEYGSGAFLFSKIEPKNFVEMLESQLKPVEEVDNSTASLKGRKKEKRVSTREREKALNRKHKVNKIISKLIRLLLALLIVGVIYFVYSISPDLQDLVKSFIDQTVEVYDKLRVLLKF